MGSAHHRPRNDPGRPEVAIIGAGVSGLVCARALHERGFEVAVFDKGRGPGGRTATRRAEIHGVEVGFDHGSQYFTVRAPALARMVAQWEALKVACPWQGRIVAIGAGRVVEPSTPTARFVGTPGMSAICGHLALDLSVRYEVPVRRIERGETALELFDVKRRPLGRFDLVVATAPPAQTMPILAHAAPDLTAKLESVRMQPCWALMTAFAPSLDAPFDGAFINDGPLNWAARNSSKPKRDGALDHWVFHANPQWSTDHLEDEPQDVVGPMLDAWFSVTQLPRQEPVWALAHRWRYARADKPLDEGVLMDQSGRVAACGDWANGNRMEGAFLSGLAAADRVWEAWSLQKP